MTDTPPTHAQLISALSTSRPPLPTPSTAFLNTVILPSATRTPSIASIAATAKFQLLASDFKTSLAATTHTLPADIHNVRIVTNELRQDVYVQIIDIDDLSKSKWEQVDGLESERKGETTKGREVIRVVPVQDGERSSTASTQALGGGGAQAIASKGPFKVLLEDRNGTRVYGFEVRRVEGIGYPPGMCIGCKVMLGRGTRVARGMVLLDPFKTVVLGGKIEGLDKEWRKGREEVLRDRVKKEVEERVNAPG